MISYGQNLFTVTGEYTFYGEKHHSLATCENYALEGARHDAISKQFGISVTQDILQHDINDNTYYSAINNTELKGEWINDIEQPKYTYSISDKGLYIVTCKVKGNIREISNSNNIDIDVVLLKNGTTLAYADNTYKPKDALYLYFKAPIDGYIAAFIIGDQHQVYRLLPYSRSNINEIKVIHDKEYIFFSNKCGDKTHGFADEITLITEDDDAAIEYNSMYIVFSPNSFIKPTDNIDKNTLEIPPVLTYEKFNKWLKSNCTRDKNMVVKQLHFSIIGKNKN